MTARIIDGKVIAADLRARVAEEVARVKRDNGLTPGLAVVLVPEAGELERVDAGVRPDKRCHGHRGSEDEEGRNQAAPVTTGPFSHLLSPNVTPAVADLRSLRLGRPDAGGSTS